MAGAIGVFAWLFLAAELVGAQSPTRVEVSLPVFVHEASGTPVPPLTRDHFSVMEGGVRRDVVAVFSAADAPVIFTLLLDTSNSLKGKFAQLQQAAIEIVRRLRPQDVARVVAFHSRVETRQDFTADTALLERAVTAARPQGSTALYAALQRTFRELQRLSAEPGGPLFRQVIVVLSDGDDTSSLVTFKDVQELARRSDVVIYTVSTGGPSTPDGDALKRLTEESGGLLFLPSGSHDASPIADQLFADLARQYIVRFEPGQAATDGKWHRVNVQVNGPLKVRTKSGYVISPAAR